MGLNFRNMAKDKTIELDDSDVFLTSVPQKQKKKIQKFLDQNEDALTVVITENILAIIPDEHVEGVVEALDLFFGDKKKDGSSFENLYR